MAGGWSTAFLVLWLAPLPIIVGFGVHRLAPEGRRLPAWPVLAIAAGTLAPAAGGLLLGFAQLVDVASPLDASTSLVALIAGQGLLAGLVWALTDERARPARLFVLGAATLVILLGLLVGPNLLGTPAGGPLIVALIGAPMLVIAAAAPGAADRWLRSGEGHVRWLGPSALGLLLLVLTIAAGGFSLVEATVGNTGASASYTWTTRIDPSGEGPWNTTVPFPVPAPGEPATVHEAFRATAEVVEGDARVRWIEPGRLAVEGEGAATVRASWAFWGSIGDREAFTDWRLANATATRGPGGPANLTVDWIVDFSGGQGHTCWAQGEATARLAPGEAAPLRIPEQESEPERPWLVACA